jgi:outer membrane protein TolC
MHKTAAARVLLFMILTAGIAAEQVSLEEARDLALANSRSLARFNLAVESSLLDEKTQAYSVLPSLSLGASAQASLWGEASFQDSLGTGVSVGMSQKLWDGGKNGYLRRINALSTGIARQEALKEYFAVLDTADRAYYGTLEAAASLEAARNALEAANLALTMAELRLESGMISYGEYLQALAEKESKETGQNQARRDLVLNTLQLKNLMGMRDTPELAAVDFEGYEELIQKLSILPDDKITLLTDAFLNAATANNPGLIQAGLRAQAADRAVSLAKRDYLPSLSASLSTGLNYSPLAGLTPSGGRLSISGTIPLDYWVIAANVEKKRIAQTESALNYQDAENALGVAIQTALLDLMAQALSVQSSRRADEYARRNYEYNLERYKLSRISVSELSDATALAGTSHIQYIKARFGFLTGLSTLRSLGCFSSQEEVRTLLLSI